MIKNCQHGTHIKNTLDECETEYGKLLYWQVGQVEDLNQESKNTSEEEETTESPGFRD